MSELAIAQEKLIQKGYLDIEVDPTLDLFEEIEKLIKQEDWPVQKTPGSEAPDSPVLFVIGKG